MKCVATALLAASAAQVTATALQNDKTAALDKVVEMLVNMQLTVLKEGEEQAKTWSKFACFCKDTTATKNELISEAEDAINKANASLEEAKSNRAKAVTDIDTETGNINAAIKEMDSLKAKRKETKIEFVKNKMDLESAILSLKKAIESVKAGDHTISFLQVQDTVKDAIMLAQAMGLKSASSKPAVALLQGDSIGGDELEYKSGSVREVLEDLLTKFKDTLNTAQSDETKSIKVFTKAMQDQEKAKSDAEFNLADAQSRKGKATARMGSLQNQLTITIAEKNNNIKYLTEVTDKCNSDKKTYDKIVEMRQDELLALTQALTIIKSSVADMTTEATVRLNQESATAEFVQLAEKKAVYAHTQKASKAKVVTKLSKSFMSAKSPLDRVMELLGAQSRTLKSAILASVASHAGKDPMEKVKLMIQNLIAKLEAESSKEQEQNQFCTKEVEAEEKTRKQSSDLVIAMTVAKSKNVSEIKKFQNKITKLVEEINETQLELKKAENLRNQQKADNEQAISDATTGQAAVEKAINVLTKFYRSAEDGDLKNQRLPTLAQVDQIPESGVEAGLYGGKQDTAVGVLGMLDVIRGDFMRTISTTEENEATQSSEFKKFKSDSEATVDSAKATKASTETLLTEETTSYSDNTNTFNDALGKMHQAMKELKELYDSCYYSGQTYEERVQKREDEIKALNDAKDILESYNA